MLRSPTMGFVYKALWLLALAGVMCCKSYPQGGPGEDAAKHAAGEVELQGRLFAPCCWMQTLDTHESEIANSLRNEIHLRLARGESSASVEDDRAARYGERIRAVPKGRDSRPLVPILIGLGMLLSALVIGYLLARWRRNAIADSSLPSLAVDRDAYDDRLDTELRELNREA